MAPSACASVVISFDLKDDCRHHSSRSVGAVRSGRVGRRVYGASPARRSHNGPSCRQPRCRPRQKIGRSTHAARSPDRLSDAARPDRATAQRTSPPGGSFGRGCSPPCVILAGVRPTCFLPGTVDCQMRRAYGEEIGWIDRDRSRGGSWAGKGDAQWR